MRDAFLRDPRAMKINIKGSSTLEVHRIKIIALGLVKLDEEGSSLTCWIKNCGKTIANLNPRGWDHLNKSQTWKET